jgi:hypothetical protein
VQHQAPGGLLLSPRKDFLAVNSLGHVRISRVVSGACSCMPLNANLNLKQASITHSIRLSERLSYAVKKENKCKHVAEIKHEIKEKVIVFVRENIESSRLEGNSYSKHQHLV